MKRIHLGLAVLLLAVGCGPAAGDPPIQDPADEAGVVHETANPLDDRGELRPADETSSGVGSADLDTPLECPVQGGPTGFGPIAWPSGTGADRWMFTETKVASVQSSQNRPVEVCGVGGELDWLVKLTCPDGSSPFASTQIAHNSRIGNTGAGGRCGTIIDLYSVPCAGQQYEVYMDMYYCLPEESFY
ncbi:MAG: hypothetical protein JRG91_17225 [Deltaproteobacteria bacterium]|nr:hypothetical protein [Deltaproteobacteria bacterium]